MKYSFSPLIACTIFMLLFGRTEVAYGFRFLSPMEASEWQVETSRFECTLSHPISGYGSGEFIHIAGEAPRLWLHGRGYSFSKQKISVVAEPPKWLPGRASHEILEIDSSQGKVVVTNVHANEILSELAKGMLVGFRGTLADSRQQPFDVYLSGVGFQGAYSEFKRCEDGLLPANFKQIERSRIQYGKGANGIPKSGMLLLDKIALYLAIDDTVKQVFIDGHTDSTGLAKDNVSMSEKRANEVNEYLLKKGVSESKLVIRFHGEKYPVASNRTAKGQNSNRRTTIRLSREMPVPEPEPTLEMESDKMEGMSGEETAMNASSMKK